MVGLGAMANVLRALEHSECEASEEVASAEQSRDRTQLETGPSCARTRGKQHRTVPSTAFNNTHTHTHARTRARAFNGPFSGTTQVSRYQQGKTNLDFTEATDSEWQWH